MKTNQEIFSFHLLKMHPFKTLQRLFFKPMKVGSSGLLHLECFFLTQLGQSIISPKRYRFKECALFAWWQEEQCLEEFMIKGNGLSKEHWHVRMKLYRKWGDISELKKSRIYDKELKGTNPMVALTLARLQISQTARFIKWGKPVETQVRDHPGQKMALAAMRPLNTFSTFSIWKNEREMLNMVQGHNKVTDGESHIKAMKERAVRPFHHEFATMRFMPLSEHGIWNGKGDYVSSRS